MAEFYNLHDLIVKDSEYIEWNNIINSISTDIHPKYACDHSINHWLRVSSVAKNFAMLCNASMHDAMLADIAGLLHDCGLIIGDERHNYTSAQIAKAFLKSRWGYNNPLTDEDIDIIHHAIICHSGSKAITNIVDAAVLFADKTHVDKSRLQGKPPVDIVAAYESKINDVNFRILSNEILLYYDVEEDFDIKGFVHEWDKAYKAPLKIAKYLNKDLEFYINGALIDCSNFND